MDCIWIHVYLLEATVAIRLQEMIMSTWKVVMKVLLMTRQGNASIMYRPGVLHFRDRQSLYLSCRFSVD